MLILCLKNLNAYNKQRNACISLLRKKETILFKFECKNIVDNKKLGKTVKIFFSNKSSSFEKIYLIEKD